MPLRIYLADLTHTGLGIATEAFPLNIGLIASYKQVANATALIWKVLLVAESRFRRLDAPEILTDVHHGVTYVDGLRASAEPKRRVAA